MDQLILPMKTDFLPRSVNYAKQLATCGDRNSYFKTDPDAIFMRMKEDHMKNGQWKPRYNVQMASHDQFILAYTVHQRPGDSRCLIPHLQEAETTFGVKAKRVIANAGGYGSKENYAYLGISGPNRAMNPRFERISVRNVRGVRSAGFPLGDWQR
jgi:hypothetical protein